MLCDRKCVPMSGKSSPICIYYHKALAHSSRIGHPLNKKGTNRRRSAGYNLFKDDSFEFRLYTCVRAAALSIPSDFSLIRRRRKDGLIKSCVWLNFFYSLGHIIYCDARNIGQNCYNTVYKLTKVISHLIIRYDAKVTKII